MLKGKKFNAFALHGLMTHPIYQLLCKRTTAVVRPEILTTSTTYPISPNNLSYLFQQQEEGE